MMRPSIETGSPVTSGPIRLSVTSHVRPICRYGPTVCDAVVRRLIAVSPGFPRSSCLGQIAVHRRFVATSQHDVETVAERLLGDRRFPVERADEALACPLVRN